MDAQISDDVSYMILPSLMMRFRRHFMTLPPPCGSDLFSPFFLNAIYYHPAHLSTALSKYRRTVLPRVVPAFCPSVHKAAVQCAENLESTVKRVTHVLIYTLGGHCLQHAFVDDPSAVLEMMNVDPNCLHLY